MKRLVLLAAVAHAWLVISAPAPACAAPPPNTAEASKHFTRGVALVEDEDWSGALAEFERAYELDPNYRVLFDIGQCKYQLHDYPGALRAFQRFLAEGKDAVAADRRAKVEADIEVLKGRVSLLRISSAATGAEVRVDDAAVGTTPLAEPVILGAGLHRITLRYRGATVSRDVTLAGEETSEVTLDPVLAPSVPVSAPAAPPPSPAPAVAAPPSLLPTWIAFGIGAAGVGVGTYFGVAALDDKKQLDERCRGKVCPVSADPLLTRSQRDALISTVSAAVGAVGLAGGVVYLTFARTGHPGRPGTTTGFVLSPGRIVAQGSF